MLPRVAILSLLVLLAGTASAETVSTWEEVLPSAAATGQLAVVDFYAEWCGPCKRFDKDLQTDAELKASVDGVVFFRTDAEKDGRDLAAEYKVSGYPTYVVLNAKGEVLGRWWGYESPQQWMTALGEVAADPATMDEKAARYAAAPTAKDARLLARYHVTRTEFEQAIDLFAQATQLDPAHEVEDLYETFVAAWEGHRRDKMEFDSVQSRADVYLTAAPDLGTNEVSEVASMMVSAAQREEDLTLAAPYLARAFERLDADTSEDAAKWRARLAVDHALVVEKDADKAVALKKARYSDGWLQDADAMNGFAWWCFENRINLVEAEEIARAAVELAETDSDKAAVLDTAAEICNARGDCHDALSLAEQALALDPHRDYYRRQVERFQKIVAAND